MRQMRVRPTRSELKDRLVSLIHGIGNIDADQITEDATVDQELQMHSVGFVELQVAIEEEYQVQIDPIQLVELNRFGDIIDYVLRCIVDTNP